MSHMISSYDRLNMPSALNDHTVPIAQKHKATLPDFSGIRTEKSKQESFIGVPLELANPPAANTAVSLDEVADLFVELEKFFPNDNLSPKAPRLSALASGVYIDDNMLRESLDGLLVAVSITTIVTLGKIAQAKGRALEIMADRRDGINKKLLEKSREECDKAVEQANKAKKAGIFSVVCDWAMSAVQIIVGAVKFAAAWVTGNALVMAGAVMNIVAGAVCFIKSLMNTLAMADPANASKYKKVAEIAAYIELTLTIIAAVVDVTSAVFRAGKVATVTKEVLQQGGGNAIYMATQSGSKVALKQACSAVANAVVERMSQQVLANFSRAGVKKIVEKSIYKTAVRFMKTSSQEGWTKQAHRLVYKKIRNDATMKLLMGSGPNRVLYGAQGMLAGATQIHHGIIKIQRGQLQESIDKLILEQQWLFWLLNQCTQSIEREKKELRRIVDAQSDILKRVVSTLSESSSLSSQMASSMA